MEDNINMGPPKRRSLIFFINNSRDSSIISKASSRPYYEQIEIQNDNLLQSNQVEDKYNSHSLNSNVEENNISNNSVSGNNPKLEK